MDCNWSDIVTGLSGEPEVSLDVEPLAVGYPIPNHGDAGDLIPGLLAIGDVMHEPPEMGIDWETLQIAEILEEEGRIDVRDPNKPSMDLGTVYPSMLEFRLAVRQFAINEEFELHIAKTDPTRYIGYCKGEDCPWHIVGRRQPDGRNIMVTVLIPEHTCTSSARRKTTTPTSAWVASKAVPIMQKKLLSTKELRDTLQEDHNCEIHYDTVWKGRQRALKELYGSWEESFQLLFNWRAEVMKHSPGSVIEIDTKKVDGKVYFHRFFCALSPCIEGFKEGCRPYISIDSSALNGRWNGHVAAATAIDGPGHSYRCSCSHSYRGPAGAPVTRAGKRLQLVSA